VADPIAFIVIPLVLAAVATLESYCQRGAPVRVDPIAALRYE